ncbi:MAG: N-acetyl-gamma-glutamyl-phosphate reductase [Bacillota bacterium]
MLVKEIAVLGATGYTGMELVRLLYFHPGVRLSFLSSESSAGLNLGSVHPQFYGMFEEPLQPLRVDQVPTAVELVFCALPHGRSAAVVPALLQRGKKVIDLSADFRLLDPDLYRQWYGRNEPVEPPAAEAVYGLPELYGAAVRGARLVANPGCYPTSIILGLAPLAREGLVEWSSVIVDAKSGVSGAGRAPRQDFHFPECTENFKAYRVACHQHTPEIEQELGRLAGEKVTLTFTPHLVPMVRGILSTIYLTPRRKQTAAELLALYRDFYRPHRFVRILEPPLLPETRLVRGTNYCDVALRHDERTGRLIIISVIDNLTRGASGQAVQNMNLMLGFAEDTGLRYLPGL